MHIAAMIRVILLVIRVSLYKCIEHYFDAIMLNMFNSNVKLFCRPALETNGCAVYVSKWNQRTYTREILCLCHSFTFHAYSCLSFTIDDY